MHWIPTGNVDTFQHVGSSWQRCRYSPDELLAPDCTSQSGPVILSGFLSARKSPHLKPEEANLQTTLSSKFAIPKWLWQARELDSNGYFYGATLPSSKTAPFRHVSVFRFMVKYVTGETPKENGGLSSISYDWHILTFVIYSEPPQKAALLCFNVPESLQDGIQSSLRQRPARDLPVHPLALHAIVLEHVVELYDQAICQFRDFVRRTEKQRPTLINPRPDYVAMHELARHVSHSSEVLATAINVVDNLLDEHKRVQQRFSIDHDPGPEIRHKRSMLQYMQNRSEALEGRLKNEINLALHIVAQHSSEASTEIAKAAKIDSSATKTISILGLLFLPGTFISAIFSMSFFNFTPATDTSPARWRISEMFWVYWVVTIPVTAMTIMWWFWWQKQLVSPSRKRSPSAVFNKA